MALRTKSFISNSASETRQIAFEFGQTLPKNSIVNLFGELGAGKTTFVKGMAQALAKCAESEVHSPTFAYLNIYKGPISVYHFDLYRLENEDAFLAMGFDEFFYADGVCCVEWSERIAKIIPVESAKVYLRHLGVDEREIEIIWEPAT